MHAPSILTPPDETAYELRPNDKSGEAVVQELLRQRARGWMDHWSWPLLKPVLFKLLGHSRAVWMADAIHRMGGVEAIRWVSDVLAMQTTASGLDRLPASGPVFIVSNHPSSVADGLVLDDLIRPKRPDLVFFANSDALRVVARFNEVLIPVEWDNAKRNRLKTRETLTMANQAIERGCALGIFPAGRIAKYIDGRLQDPSWEPTAVSMARRKGVPILPAYMTGRSSRLYYWADKISEPLRDMTLFHEMLARKGRQSHVNFGPLIPPDQLEGEPSETIKRLKAYIETDLKADPDAAFT